MWACLTTDKHTCDTHTTHRDTMTYTNTNTHSNTYNTHTTSYISTHTGLHTYTLQSHIHIYIYAWSHIQHVYCDTHNAQHHTKHINNNKQCQHTL